MNKNTQSAATIGGVALDRDASGSERAPGVEQLHILPVSLLETSAASVSEFLDISRALQIPLGWHYLLDLAWAAAELQQVTRPDSIVLDAGAGTGLMQWWLTAHGVGVISVDREARYFSRRLRAWSPVVDFTTGKRLASAGAIRHLVNPLIRRRLNLQRLAAATRKLTVGDRLTGQTDQGPAARRGTVRVLKGDLVDLREVGSESVDAVVSISSLEHNSPENLARVVAELMRILRPGGKLVATLGASKDRDWYHEPSSGWCFTAGTLCDIFSLPRDCPSNYADYDALFEALASCDYLRESLSDFYFHAGNNGMPWGRWDPQYQSVGVVKVKPQ